MIMIIAIMIMNGYRYWLSNETSEYKYVAINMMVIDGWDKTRR